MTIGQTYEIAWTGAAGAVEIYAKKDPSPSSWRAHVYGGGNDASYNWTVIDLLEPERTYIFSAYDYGTEEIYNSEPIFVHAAPTPNVRGRWVARQF
ncbi:hypothetical protein LTR70_006357 [Exophiala xenobiotica]|uniref:Uncharacterized protein n=1 Tax=Lithohypha guttulata TaxID=1690604 RepID=A0ABR0K811_9EURO|nr:hypothetical protein LTR24_005826 [Lithohypha guttulata]KAK5316302.1 hypothetical protein LTR70_006357 [Exophiala xenobiotica]